MTFDKVSQVSIHDEPTMRPQEYDEAYEYLAVQRKNIEQEMERMAKLKALAIQREQEELKNEQDNNRVCMSTHIPQWACDAFENDFMPLLKEKVRIGNRKFNTSMAIRYLLFFAIKNAHKVEPVEAEELKKFLFVE